MDASASCIRAANVDSCADGDYPEYRPASNVYRADYNQFQLMVKPILTLHERAA